MGWIMSAEHEDFKSESTPVSEPVKMEDAQAAQTTNVRTLPLPEESSTDMGTNPAEDWAEEQTQVLREEDNEHLDEAWLLIGGDAHVKIDSFPFTLGRAKSSSLPLNGKGISRHHAHILYQGGRYLIVDQQSLNGVEVNGYIVSRVLLEDGDQIKIGDQEIRFTHRHPLSDPNQKPTERTAFAFLVKGIAISFATVAIVAVGYFGYQRMELDQRVTKLPFVSTPQAGTKMSTPQGDEKVVLSSVDGSGHAKAVSADEKSRPTAAKMMLTNSRTPSADSENPNPNSNVTTVAPSADTSGSAVENKKNGGLANTKDMNVASGDTTNRAVKRTDTKKASIESEASSARVGKPERKTVQPNNSVSTNPKNVQTATVASPTKSNTNTSSSTNQSVASSQQARNNSGQSIVVAKNLNQQSLNTMELQRARTALQQSTNNVAVTNSVPNDDEFSSWRQQSINRLREGSDLERRRAALEIAEYSIQAAEEKYLAGEGEAVLDVLSELEQSPYLNENRKLDVQAVLEWLRPLYGKFSEGERHFNRADKEIAFAKWELFLAEESKRFGDRSSAYAERVATKVVEEYLMRAEEAYDQSRFHEAFALWQRAVFIDGNEEAKLKLAEMEMKARELYRKALRAETVNASQARRYWQEVINFVPPGTEYYTKAKAKLAWYVHWGD